MPAIITTAVTAKGFEILRDRIGEILASELPNQSTLLVDAQVNATVFVERFVKIGHDETPVVNVTFAGGKLEKQDKTTSRGEYDFNIDVYVSAGEKSGVDADKVSNLRLTRLLGVCMGILEHQSFERLGFAAGFVMSKSIVSVDIASPPEAPEALSVTMGRLVLRVVCPEIQGIAAAVLIEEFKTTVKLHSTDYGYIFTEFPEAP